MKLTSFVSIQCLKVLVIVLIAVGCFQRQHQPKIDDKYEFRGDFTGRGIYYSIFVNRHGMAYVSKVIMSNDELSFLTFRNYTSNVFKLDSAQVFLISLRKQVDHPSIRRWDTDNPHCEMFYNGIKI